jgi:hypothetical protein
MENLPFPAFKIEEFKNEKWEDSELYNDLESQKIFFVIFKINTKTTAAFERLNDKEKNQHLILDRVELWNPPASDIDNLARPTWEKTISTIKK